MNAKQFFLIILLHSITLSFTYTWQLQMTHSQTIVNNQASFYQFKALKEKSFPVLIDVVVLNHGQYKAGLYIQQSDNVQSVLDIATQKHAFLATSGGYYREGFLVNGLLIDQNKLRLPLINNSLLSSVITINQNGQINILDKAENYGGATHAFQVGPNLLKDNRVQRLEDEKVATRIIYAQTDSKIIVIYIDSSTLQQAAYIVKAVADYFKFEIKRAVNFDGGKAGAFVLRKYIPPVIYPEYSPVKSVVYFLLS